MKPAAQVFGLPPKDQLQSYRIWDSYFTPSFAHPGADGTSKLIADIERSMPAIETGCIEKLCYFAHVGIGTTNDGKYEAFVRTRPDVILKPFDRWPNLFLGMIQLNANDVAASLDALNRWLSDGPMLGVYFASGGPGSLPCTHRNMRPLVERIIDLQGVIMQHTWFKIGGKDGPNESTPTELAELAAIYFGSHLPSRSLGTELSKIVGAEISERDKRRILGENYRQLIKPV